MEQISKEEIDILGEIANISMGNAATALSIMLNHRVDITTPRISVINRSESLDDYENTCIFVQIHYVKGLSGNNVLILKEHDVLCMTDMMMGGDGTTPDSEMNEMHMSAASEAMNQMMGKAATSMATLYDTMVDISTPDVHKIDVESVKTFEKMFETNQEKFIKISFRIEVGDVIDSTMVQLYPVSFALEMCDKFRKRKAAGAIPEKD